MCIRDSIGGMYETSSKSYRYMNSGASISDDGTLITTPTIWGTDSETLGHSQPFENLAEITQGGEANYFRNLGNIHSGGCKQHDRPVSYTHLISTATLLPVPVAS